jgi:diguanylate cyclase (GGDEF)-like protein
LLASGTSIVLGTKGRRRGPFGLVTPQAFVLRHRSNGVAEFLSQRLTARLGAVLFVLSGVVTLVNLALPSATPRDIPSMIVIGSSAVVLGAICWFLPWQRWPRSATLPLVPMAFAMIAAGGVASLRPWSYAVYWVVVFVWLGVAQPRLTSAKFAPLAAGAYIAPFFVVDHGGIDAFTSVAVVIPVCLLVGESLAWISGMLRKAERLDLRRMVDMESLLEATVSLARQDEAVGAANLVAELAVKLLRADAAVVLLADGDGVLRGTGGCQWRGRCQALEATWVDAPAREALDGGDVVIHHGGIAGKLTRAGGGAPALFLPLLGSSGALGLVMVTFPNGTRLDLDGFTSGLTRTFATQASLAFERLQATQVLLDASMRDALTGVGNRRQADALLAGLKPGDAVVLLDLDRFKAVNDQWGHATGDEVLVGLARYLDRSLRDGDTVTRFGGEEFLLVLRQAGGQALGAVERLAEGWRRTSPITTFSAGVALHSADCRPEATLVAADSALYRAKHAGRDCARQSDGPVAEMLGIA